jgi:hypothetical protein
MRIIIDIEGENVTVRTERAEEPGAMSVSESPPPELLRAAAARGATSAGPAPREGEMAEPAVALSAVPAEARAEPVDAGGAPFPPPGKSSEEGEKRSGDIEERP